MGERKAGRAGAGGGWHGWKEGGRQVEEIKDSTSKERGADQREDSPSSETGSVL